MQPLETLQSADFSPYLNDLFLVRLDAYGGEPIELELVRVTETGFRSQPGGRTPFSLDLLGPVSDQYLLQHMYRLEHETMDRLDLFLVPLGPEGGRMRYEAIFA